MKNFLLLCLLVLSFLSLDLNAKETMPQSFSTKINRAKAFYDYGNYKETVKILEEVLKDTSQLNSPALLNTYQLIARAYYYQQNKEYAEFYLKLLFLLRFDYQFDPVFINPKFIDFANKVYKKYSKEIIKNRDDLAELLRKKNPDKYDDINVTKHFYKNFIPFGVGQFQNGHRYKAYMLIGIESISLLTSVTSYILLKYYQRDDYTFSNASLANKGVIINNVSFFVFLGVYLYATIDGIVYYNASDIKVIQSNNFEFFPVITEDLKYVNFKFSF